MALAYQLVTERRDHMGLACARIAEHAQVRGSLQKLPFDQTRNLGAYRRGEAPGIERRHRLVTRELRFAEQSRDPPLGAFDRLHGREFVEVVRVAPAALGRLVGQWRIVGEERRQPEGLEPQLQRLGAHADTSSPERSAS